MWETGGTHTLVIVFNISVLAILNICGGVRANPSTSAAVTDLKSQLRANARVSPAGHYLSRNKHFTRALLVQST